MIHYLVTRDHAYTMQTFLETWNRDTVGRVSFEVYEDLPYWRHIAGGTYIFSDLERLSAPQLRLAQSYADQLRRHGAKIINEPRHVLRRYDLLKLMNQTGINPFGVYRLNEPRAGLKFPVFVREENEHTGSLTDLLQTEAELQQAIAALIAKGDDSRQLLIVEYCHTADEQGIFRKYAAMKIDGKIIPRHVLFSGEWVDKHPDVLDVQKLAEEAAYLKLNPHREELAAIFELAKIEYGRIDYAYADGQVIVWEINTNPVIAPVPSKCDPERLPGQARSANAISAALESLDTPTNGQVIDLHYDRQLIRDVGVSPIREATAKAKRMMRACPILGALL
ncbi:MAG TPA: hypothetical protein VF669_07985 [Tepidisphaeraceae bacterium]|jgi:hypothetical protein